MFKLYNPFKWHIFECNGKFCIKRSKVICSEFLDLNDRDVWSDLTDYYLDYCFGTYEQCVDRLRFNVNRKSKPKYKIVK